MGDVEVARILRDAAVYLRAHGWTQGGYGNDGGERCISGALQSVCGLSLHEYESGPDTILHSALGFSDAFSADLFNWNDALGRTVEEVLDRLESTALALEVRALAAAEKPVEVPVPA